MNRLKELRKANNMTQAELSKMLGINQNTYSYWENDKVKIDKQSLFKISEIFDVSVDYILGNRKIKTQKGIKIPVLGYVRAGIPIDAVEEILDYEEISQEMADQGDYFALSVKGDSMEPRIQEGDVVIVRKQSDVDSGEIAVVLVNGNDATIKKFIKHENGVSLVAFNAKYEPMFYTCQEVEDKPVTVLGKVVELRGKF